MNSADQIGQLIALRSEMQSGKRNLSWAKSGEISENEMHGKWGEFQKTKLTTNMGELREK